MQTVYTAAQIGENMAGQLPYRKASGEPVAKRVGESGVPRWMLLLGLCVLTFVAAWVLAGNEFVFVVQTWGYGFFAVVLFLCAGLCGLPLTVGFARRGVFARSAWPAGLQLVAAIGIGLGLFAFAVLLLGYVHLLNPPWAVALVPVAGAVGGLWIARGFAKRMDVGFLRRRVRRAEWLLLLAAIPVGAMLVAATFPPGSLWTSEGRGYDVLEYHLQMPREYAVTNAVSPVTHNVYSALPANVEMLYLLEIQTAHFVFNADDINPRDGYLFGILPSQFLHAGLMLLTAAAVGLGPLRMSSGGRVIAMLLVLSVPWTIITGSLAYNEGGMLLFGVLGLMAALGVNEKSRIAGGLLCGIFLGFSIGCKLTAGVFFALPVGVILLLRGELRACILATLLAAAVFSPWAIRAAVFSDGNPVFPVASTVLGKGAWTQEQAERFDVGHAAKLTETTSTGRLSERLSALLHESVLDSQWSPSLAIVQMGDAWWKKIGVLWLIVPLVLVFANLRGRVGWWLTAMLVLQVLAWLFATQLQSRFLLPIEIPLALLVGLAIDESAATRWISGSVMAVQALAAIYLLAPEAGLFVGVKKGWDPPPIGEIFSRQVDIAAIIENPNGESRPLLPGAKILLVGNSAPLFFQGDIVYNTVFDDNLLGDALRRGGPHAAADWLKQEHIRYIVIDWQEIRRLRSTYGFDDAITPPAIAGLLGYGVTPVGATQSEGITLLRVETP